MTYISLKAEDTQLCHPWRKRSWRYAHNFLLFQLPGVLWLCNNTLGLAEVRLGKEMEMWQFNWRQNSFRSFSLFSLSANSFTFPIESARKTSSENHTKGCFLFITESVTWLALTSLCCPGCRGAGAKATAWHWEKAFPRALWGSLQEDFDYEQLKKWELVYKREYFNPFNVTANVSSSADLSVSEVQPLFRTGWV